ncbi:MAG: pseudouridine synthase [Nitrospinota bacterium]
MLVRLQKIIAQAGVASRRRAEQLIREGRVTVNGRRVRELGAQADPERDHIRVEGKLLKRPEPSLYFLLHKPRNVLTTVRDEEEKGRPTVMDFLRGVRGRVFPVGRLDFDAEGLVLLTNDGALAHGLMHPRYGVPRRYEVKVKGVPNVEALARLEAGRWTSHRAGAKEPVSLSPHGQAGLKRTGVPAAGPRPPGHRAGAKEPVFLSPPGQAGPKRTGIPAAGPRPPGRRAGAKEPAFPRASRPRGAQKSAEIARGGPAAPAEVELVRVAKKNAWLRVTLREGRTHQIKRMFGAVGHPVLKIKRVGFGPLSLRGIPPGGFRRLTDQEVEAVRSLVQRRAGRGKGR